MISNSKSFEMLKSQIQSILDFSVLCCQAVPALNGYMKAVELGSAPKLPDADYFKGSPNFQQLKSFIPDYRKNLGKLLFLSSFSFFEAYFKSLINEILEFHGGVDNFVEISDKKMQQHLRYAEEESPKTSAKKLREYPKTGKEQKYTKHAKLLEKSEFRFPSELFATFGIIELSQNYRDLKASQIPHVAKWCFGVSLSENEVEDYGKYRDLRNRIAHGKAAQVEFKEANEVNKFLRSLALKIDKHVVAHFFVIEKYN